MAAAVRRDQELMKCDIRIVINEAKNASLHHNNRPFDMQQRLYDICLVRASEEPFCEAVDHRGSCELGNCIL